MEKRPAYAVVRADDVATDHDTDVLQRIAVVKIYLSQQLALAEVDRLNSLNGHERCRYECLTTRLYSGD